MNKPAILAASVALVAAASAQAIDAEYRRLLERSGCTQVSEMQGCDIHKTKKENVEAGFVSERAPAAQGIQAAEKACLAAVAKTVGKPSGRLSVGAVVPAGSDITVMVLVPGATAPWSCLSDAKGHVRSTMFTGKDGD